MTGNATEVTFEEIANQVNAVLKPHEPKGRFWTAPEMPPVQIPNPWESDLAAAAAQDKYLQGPYNPTIIDLIKEVFTDDAPVSKILWSRFWQDFGNIVCDEKGVIRQSLSKASNTVTGTMVSLIVGLISGKVVAAAVAAAARILAFLLIQTSLVHACPNLKFTNETPPAAPAS